MSSSNAGDNSTVSKEQKPKSPTHVTAESISRPDDVILEVLNSAVSSIKEYRSTMTKIADQVDKTMDIYTKLHRHAIPEEPTEAGGAEHSDVAAAKHARRRDERDALLSFQSDEHAALSAFEAAQFDLTRAIYAYDYALSSAATLLQDTAAPAVAAFETKVNPDSSRHSSKLYYQMKVTVAGAVQAYEASVGTAQATLAAASGAMLTAYTTLAAAVATAESKRLLAEATASEAYWQSIEGLRT